MSEKDHIHLSEEGAPPPDSSGININLLPPSTDRIANKNHILSSRQPRALLLSFLFGLLLLGLAAAGAYYFFGNSSSQDDPLEIVQIGPESEDITPDMVVTTTGIQDPVEPEQADAPTPLPTADPRLPEHQDFNTVPEKPAKPGPLRVFEPTNMVVKNKTASVATDQRHNLVMYSLQGGVFLVHNNLTGAEKTIRALGYEPQHKKGKKPVKMTRLRVGRYSPEEGRAKVQSLKKIAPDAFLLKDDDQVVVYAGSYHEPSKATRFAESLAQQELQVKEEGAEVMLPVTTLTFGEFPNMITAQQAADRARKNGLEIIIIKQK